MSSKAKTSAKKDGSQHVLVPKLRFPEFREAEEWDQAQIGHIAICESSTLALNKLSLRLQGNPVYGADGCVGFIDSFTQDDDYIAIVKDGSGVGRLSLNRGKSSVLGTLACLKCKPNAGTTLPWLFYCLNSLDLRKYVKGSGIPHIYFSDYVTHEVLVPSTPEQQKIGSCLGSVDELIAAQGRKLDALKTHKKGLMQQLFPREGENQPRQRFPEFQNAGDWVAKRLSEMIYLISGMHLSPDEYSPTGEVPYFTGPSDFTNDLQNATKWTKRSANVSQAEDTLITVKGSGVGEIWYSMLPEVALGRQLMAVRTKHGSSRFMFQFLLTKRSRFEDLGSGNLIPGLSRAAILELEAHFPSPPEQERIADCLTSLDDLIIVQTQKLDALKAHKKGLMQQLFPSPDEVEA